MDKKDVVHIHSETLLSPKNNELMPSVATWTDLEMIILGELSQTKTNIIVYHLQVESNFLNYTNELIYKIETDLRDIKNKRITDFKNKLTVQFSAVAQSCPTLCHSMNRSTPGLPVHHQLPEFTQTYVHRVGDAIQPSHPLSSPSPPAPNPSQHQSLFQ